MIPMKIPIPLLGIVFTLSALFYSIQNSIDQFGQSFAGYDRLSNHRNNPAALQNSLISFDSPLACQQNAFYPSDNSKQKLFQKDLCDCATQWYASKYNPDLQEVKKACQMLQESGGLDVACVESRIEVYEPFTYDSYNNACKGSYSFVFVLSDGTKQEEQWRDIGVTFDEAKFMCQMLSGNQVVDTPTPEFLNPPDPGPNPGPNPNPNPNPEPSPIDPEILSILQSILGTPVIPITGAVAGGLVAWVISMLSGGRTVLPTAPRPPTGGVRPGQVGPDGKVWSPGQGWVTKSTYDYQQKWIQKGWRLNSQTGKLEVQPGAINERGKVWYKLPHAMDEGDSHNWVDKAKVEECERNLAEGNVWDRNVGWKAPEDLKRRYSDQDAIHRRSIIDNAAKNAQIQKDVQDASQKRQEEYQDWLKKYEYKEQMPVKLTKLNADMDAIDQDLKKQNIYVTNKLQGDPTLIFQGLEVLTNGVWDSTIGNFTGSQGFTCGNYVDKTINPVTEAVKKQFPGAKVQQVVFEEKSTKNPSGFFGTLDSWNTENHTLIKVTIPDGPELAVDFHQQHPRAGERARRKWGAAKHPRQGAPCPINAIEAKR